MKRELTTRNDTKNAIEEMLRDHGPMTYGEIAGELDIARSTAHKALAEMTYNDRAQEVAPRPQPETMGQHPKQFDHPENVDDTPSHV